MLDVSSKEKRHKFYNSTEWKAMRASVLERDNYECQECKRQGRVNTNKHKRLDVDHIEELKDRPDLALEPENLQTLCIRCHNKKHNRYDFKYYPKKNKNPRINSEWFGN